MNNRLRKRFLGAGVVVALAAIILPFLLQGEGYKANRQLTESAQTRIPPRPPAAASLDTNTPPPPEDVRAAMNEPESLPEPVPVPTPALPAGGKPPSSEPAKPKPVPAPATTPSPKPVTEVKVKPLDKPVEKPAEKLPAKPMEALTPKPAEKPILPPVTQPVAKPAAAASAAPAAQTEAWLIQLGSFTAESNAQNLLAQVQRVGVSAKVERIDVKGSPVWRVTSGTYATRTEADAALNLLKTRLNLGGMVRPAR